MQLEREPASEPNAILGCADGEVRLRGAAHTTSLIVTRERVIDGWRPAAIEQLTIDDFAAILDVPPEILAARHRRLAAHAARGALRGLAERGIGLEAMDNRAACRTYNLLLSEYRNVAAASCSDQRRGSWPRGSSGRPSSRISK